MNEWALDYLLSKLRKRLKEEVVLDTEIVEEVKKIASQFDPDDYPFTAFSA